MTAVSGAAGPPASRAELVAIVATGVLHVALEVSVTEDVALLFSAVAAVGWLAYLGWRAGAGRDVLRAWGFRTDTFWAGLRAQVPLALVGAMLMLAYGLARGTVSLPAGFWITLVVYPVWGTTQQFALQNLIARNLIGLLSRPASVALAAAVLFGVSHVPRWPLVALTVVAGFFFTAVYRRVPNLWAVGLMHGLLGTLAIYFVSGEDPGGAFWHALTGR